MSKENKRPKAVMDANEYQRLAMRTAPYGIFDNYMDAIDNAALGLCGEAGEFADLVKKHIYQNHQLERDHMGKELGDVLWYISMAATALGYDMEELMEMNIEKLQKRYPNGFEAERSQNREEGDI